ncbi:hypothetical protein DPX16_17092 [Anabarilius grahami]|uniref:Uncharacterized protein n=1 Tax=Anabarilius grahami TaxID=495550 RepID=A0A3N0YBM2_ANAGA|nr:hypothetical protein DPX16_17092 [Anabarilius grahami]
MNEKWMKILRFQVPRQNADSVLADPCVMLTQESANTEPAFGLTPHLLFTVATSEVRECGSAANTFRAAMSGPAYRRELPQRNNKELYGGDRMGSSAQTELQTDVTFKQQSPGGKNNVCTHIQLTSKLQIVQTTNKSEREN